MDSQTLLKALSYSLLAACIAAATRADGGQFDGVAPEAGLYSCRTLFYSSELVSIYDYLADEARRLGQPIIASNSWGMQTGTPPTTDDPDFQQALRDAQAAWRCGARRVLASSLPSSGFAWHRLAPDPGFVEGHPSG